MKTKTRTIDELYRQIKDKAIKPDSILCKIGIHSKYEHYREGFIMTLTILFGCKRCGHYWIEMPNRS